MANRYDNPYDFKIPTKPFLAPIDVLGKALEIKQKQYDTNQAALEEIPLIADKVKALGGHKDIVNGVVNNYYEELLDSAEKHAGDFSMLTPKLLNVKRRLARDMSPNGTLGSIHSFATSYEEWYKTYKNDKDIDTGKLSGVANLFRNSTYNDLNKFSKEGRVSPYFNPIEIPRSISFIQERAMSLASKVQDEQSDEVRVNVDAFGTRTITKHKVTRKNPNVVGNLLNQFGNGDADVRQQLYTDRLLGINSNIGGILNSVKQSATAVKEDNDISISDMSEAAYDRRHATATDTDELSGLTAIATKNNNPVDISKSPVYDFFNKHNSGSWNGKYVNGQLVNPNDGSMATKIENMANAHINHMKGKADPSFESTKLQEFRNKLRAAQTVEDFYKIAEIESPKYIDNSYTGQVMGKPIVDAKELKAASANVIVAATRGSLKDVNGNIISDSNVLGSIKKEITEGKAAYFNLPIKHSRGSGNIAVVTSGATYFVTPDAKDYIQASNSIDQFHKNGNAAYFTNPETGAIEFVESDEQGIMHKRDR